MSNACKLKTGVALFLLVAGLLPVQAQTDPINVTTTSVPFLRISPDARAGGMGNIGIATSPDANSSFYNAAKMPFAAKKSAIGINYTPWLKDIADKVFLATAAGYYQFDEQQALSAGLRYFNMGDLTLTDYNGSKLQTSKPREWSLDVAYSRKLSDRLGIALALRYINSRLGAGDINGTTYKTGSAVAGDVSVFYNGLNATGEGFTAGVVLSNVGSKINYTDNADNKEFIPANLGLGGAYTKVVNQVHKLMIGADINKLMVPAVPADSAGMYNYRRKAVMEGLFSSFDNSSYQLSFGGEYTYDSLFTARLGYTAETKKGGDRKGFTTGIGLQLQNVQLNFSYLVPSGNGISRNPLGNTIRFGLVWEME